MINLRNLNAAMEGFKMEDDDADVTIEQTIEIEVAADEEVTENVELEEAIDNSEDVVEETEQMLATLEFAAHAEAVIQEFGWSRPVATMLNRGQDVRKGIPGDLEVFLGVTMPANESLDMVSSAYDDNTVAALEGFKETMEKFWKWIKEQAVKIKNFFFRMWERVAAFFVSGLKASKRLAEMIKKVDIDEAKLKDKKLKIVSFDNLNKTVTGSTMANAVRLVDLLTDVIRATATTLDSDKPYNPIDSTIIANIKTLLVAVFPGASITDEGVITIDKKEAMKKFDEKEQSLADAHWDKNTTSNTAIAEECQRVINKINSSKVFMNAVKSIEKKATKFTKVVEGSDSSTYKDAKDNAKKILKFMSGLQKVLSTLSKMMSYAMRQFIRAQRAVLACRK